MRFIHVRPNPQNAAPFHRFETVFDDVIKRLLHLAAIKLEQWQIGAQFRLHHDVARFDLGREKAHRFLYDGVNIFGLKLRTRRPDRAQELGNDGIESIDLASTNLEVPRDRTTTVGERIPIKSSHSFLEQFAYGILAIEAEKLAGGVIQISNAAG